MSRVRLMRTSSRRARIVGGSGQPHPGSAVTQAMISTLIDKALDLSIVGGYTKIGYGIRQRAWGPLPRMEGRVVLVTGATSGLGLAAADGFAGLGASVWLVARDRARGERARESVLASRPGSDIQVGVCDLSNLSSIRSFATEFVTTTPRLDVLVNNAGVMTRQRELSADGIELTLATNVVGPLLLTRLLIPTLQRSAPSRIVNVSSGGMYTQRLPTGDLQSERGHFDGPTVYARTKRMEVVLTEMLSERLSGTGVTVHAMHPGWADTPGLRASLPRFQRALGPLLRSPRQGADTIVWLGAASEPGANSGGFWHDRRLRPTHLLPSTRERGSERDELWAACQSLTGCRADMDTSVSGPGQG